MGGPSSTVLAKSKISQIASFGKTLFVKAVGVKLASAAGVSSENFDDSWLGSVEGDHGQDGGFNWDSIPVKDTISAGLTVAGLIRCEQMYQESNIATKEIQEKLDLLLEVKEEAPKTFNDAPQTAEVVPSNGLEESLSLVIGQKIALEGVDKWSHLVTVDAEADVIPFLERTSCEELATLEGLDLQFSNITEIRHGLVYGDLLKELGLRGSSLVKLLV
jgi:hypothetical protein